MGKRCFLKITIVSVVIFTSLIGCTIDGFNKKEIARIEYIVSNSSMPLLLINNKSDSLFLRQDARKIRKNNIGSSYMEQLKLLMLRTVNDSLNQGVGISAPQVGVGIQMIIVQRTDKIGEPFEIYYNPKIEEYGDSINSGIEGCLSVPGFSAKVDRSHNIQLSYLDSTGEKKNEEISGFAAVIFQHEIDHLNGVIYFDHVFGGFNSLTPVEGN